MRTPAALPTSDKLSAAAEKSIANHGNHVGLVTLVLPETLPCREDPAKVQIRPALRMDRSHSLYSEISATVWDCGEGILTRHAQGKSLQRVETYFF